MRVQYNLHVAEQTLKNVHTEINKLAALESKPKLQGLRGRTPPVTPCQDASGSVACAKVREGGHCRKRQARHTFVCWA